MHVVLLLPVARARAAAVLVQGAGLPCAHRRRAAGGLAELGLELDESVEVRVWDSSAEMRYLVLPERPEGTDDLAEHELAALVTRDSMIGVAEVEAPS